MYNGALLFFCALSCSRTRVTKNEWSCLLRAFYHRVGQSPDAVRMLTKEGFRVVVESGAGLSASFTDAAYEEAGAIVVKGDEAWKADIVVKVMVYHAIDLRIVLSTVDLYRVTVRVLR